MAFYNATVKHERMNRVIAYIDIGTGHGKIKIGTAGMTAVLVVITLPQKPCASDTNGTMVFLGTPVAGTATGAGTAAEAVITDSDDNVIVGGLTVSETSGNLLIDSVLVEIGQVITLNSAVITHG